MGHGKGTTHYKLHGLVGWGLIIGLPCVLWSAVSAIPAQSGGFIAWLNNPVGAIGFLAFFTAAIWYCKLEFDEVVMDYFGGGVRSFGLLANRAVAFIVWVMAAYASLMMWLG